MIEIPAGEYECATCKKLTVIPRKKKADEPLTCCGAEMVLKPKTKFTEPPAPKAASSKAGAASKTRTKTKTRSKKATSSRTTSAAKADEVLSLALTLPLSPGVYMCPTCGVSKTLSPQDDLSVWFRCPDCYVKMLPCS